MEIVYLETSFISLLVANPSRDLVTAANQQSTRDWWRLRRGEFVCVASSEVVREKRAGWKLPKVCTPPELMGDSTYETESDS